MLCPLTIHVKIILSLHLNLHILQVNILLGLEYELKLSRIVQIELVYN